MKSNVLIIANFEGKRIGFTRLEEFTEWANRSGGQYKIQSLSTSKCARVYDENAKAVEADSMDKKTAYIVDCNRDYLIAFNSELARGVLSEELEEKVKVFYEVECFRWAEDAIRYGFSAGGEREE